MFLQTTMHKRIEIEMPSDAVLTTTSVLSPASVLKLSTSSSSLLNGDSTNTAANTEANSNKSETPKEGEAASSAESTTTTPKIRKIVTFRNQLETSDDKDAVKKFYNPNNSIPLVSIIKKECLNRPMMYSRSSECIVRPSRLTEILKNNSNIDKLNSLKFRSTHSSQSSAPNVFGAGLFDVPEDDLKQEETITFHRRQTADSDKSEEDEASSSDTEENELEDRPTELNVGKAELEVKDIKTSIAKQELADQTVEQAEEEEEQQMIVDKHFVLPKRSNRSFRVIKPNKRLLDDGSICKKSLLNTKKEVSKPIAQKKETTLSSSSSSSLAGNYFGLGKLEEKEKSIEQSINKDNSESKSNFLLNASSFGSNFGLGNVASKISNNFVLRQPKLQFEVPSSLNSSALTQAATSNAFKLSSSLTPKFGLSATTATTPTVAAVLSCTSKYICKFVCMS